MNNNEYAKQNSLHGTTTVGITCKDGIVLCADTRAVLGSYYIAHRNVKKISKIENHFALTIAGGVADAQNIIDQLKYNSSLYKLENKQKIPVQTAARLVSNVFFNARMFPYMAAIIVGGVDNNGPAIYNVDLFGTLTKEKFLSTGSGSPVAYGVLENEYSENIEIKEGIGMAVRAVISAIRRNAGTGDGFDIITIDKTEFKNFSVEEKEKILLEATGRKTIG